MKNHLKTVFVSTLLLASAVVPLVTCAGIPEPGLTLYGVVRQDLGGAHARLTTGDLELQTGQGRPRSRMASLVAETEIANHQRR